MKSYLTCALLVSACGTMQAAIIETISFNLSSLHAGSTLSGAFTLSDSPKFGDTAAVLLTFSDPADYSPISIPATITIGTGTPSGYLVDFSGLTFTNLSGVVLPIDTRDVDLSRTALARCTSFPCTASGGFQDRSPAVFSSSYTISPAAAVPEPGYVLLSSMLLALLLFGRRVTQRVM